MSRQEKYRPNSIEPVTDSSLGSKLVGKKESDSNGVVEDEEKLQRSIVKETRPSLFCEQLSTSRIDAIKNRAEEARLSGHKQSTSLQRKTNTETKLPEEAINKRAVIFYDVVSRLEKQKIAITKKGSSSSLPGGLRQTEEIVEFTVNGTTFKLQMIVRPKVVSVTQHYVKREGSAQTNIVYSKTEMDVLVHTYKLTSGKWLMIDLQL